MTLQDEADLARARAELEQRGTATRDLLAPDILASWNRCLAAGLDPRQPPPMRVMEARMLREMRERHEFVSRLALAEMRSLYHQIAGTNYMIAFAAPDGMLLETLADPTFHPTAQRSGICPGGLWAEALRGTNALGTVGEVRRPITVHGGEHFFSQFGGLTCTAAPVFGPDAELVGILDASSDCRSRQQHTRALVSMAVTHIENSLFREHHRANLVLVFHSRPEYLRTPSAGLIAVDANGTVLGINAQARFLLQGLPALPGRRFGELFRTEFGGLVNRARSQERLLLHDVVGSAFAASAENLPPPRPVSLAGPERERPPQFVAADKAVATAAQEAGDAGRRNLPILIRGETGTGKELLARHAHQASGRRGPFVPVNCAALPKSLIESELFGHAEGAFTGARRRGAKGLVEEADGGTLFLDEIGDMAPDLQAVLLRLLDDWTVRPVGGLRRRRVDVLLISATNADLEQRIAAGTFRRDLLYRLSVIDLRLPSLAERRDFREIAAALLAELAPGTRLAPEVLDRLETRAWPGNIRELRSVLVRLTLAAPDGVIDAETATRCLGSPPRPLGAAATSPMRDAIRGRISEVYRQEGENISRTARRLGVSRNTVYRAVRASANASA